MKVLFATTNPAKVKYYAEALKNNEIQIITLNEIDINIEVEESGSSPVENAILKAEAYHRATGLDTISIDDGLFIDGLSSEQQPGPNVRRVNGKRLDDKEMLEHYTSIAKRFGGQVKGYWIHGLAVCTGGKTVTFEKRSDRVFTSNVSDVLNEGYPLDSISIVPEYGIYRSELSKTQIEEQNNKKNKAMFDFILKALNKS